MIDIHTHVLPGVDDGSPDLGCSRELLMQAKQEGITDIILTVHYDFEGQFHMTRADLMKRLAQFKEEVADFGINLYLGSEIYVYKRMLHELKKRRCSTLANSYYVLVEFPFGNYEEEYDDYLFDMKKFGCRIIIAHPERYSYVRDNPEFVKRWTKEGYFLQCNASAYKHHPNTFKALMDMNAVQFIASDAHGPRRPISLKGAYDFVAETYGKEKAEALFVENPARILRNEAIV